MLRRGNKNPRLDRLAEEGARFSEMYNCARCCPSRASLLTGLYPHQHKVLGNDPAFEPAARKGRGPAWLRERAEHDEPFVSGIEELSSLADLLADRFLEEHRVDLRGHRHATAKTLIAAEQIKMQLTDKPEVEGAISELDYGEGGVALGLDFRITRADLEALLFVAERPLSRQELRTVARLSAEELDRALLAIVPAVLGALDRDELRAKLPEK